MMALPPTSANHLQHILRANLQVMLCCEGPPDELRDITNYWWESSDKIPIPVIAEGDPAAPNY